MKHCVELFQSIRIFWPLKVYRGQSKWTESSAKSRWRWWWWSPSKTGTSLSSQNWFHHHLTIRSQSLLTETHVPHLARLKTGCKIDPFLSLSLPTFEAEPSSPAFGALCDVDFLIVSHRGEEAEGGAGNSHHCRAGRHKESRVPLSLRVSSPNAGQYQTKTEDQHFHF